MKRQVLVSSTQQQKIDQIFKKIIWWSILIILMVVPLIFSLVNQELFELPKIVVLYLVAIVAVMAWAGRCILTQKIIWKPNLLDIPIALFLISQIVATIFSQHLGTSLVGYYTRFNGGLLSMIAYISLWAVMVNNFEWRDYQKLIKFNLIALTVVSLWAIGEHFGHSLSCLIITGQFNVSCWIQDVQTRVFASFGQPNWLAGYLSGWIGIILVWLIGAKVEQKMWLWGSLKKTRIILVIVLIMMVLALFYTKSRSGILAGIASFLIVLSISWWQKWRLETRKKWTKIVMIALGLMAVLTCIGGWWWQENRLQIKNSEKMTVVPTSMAGGTDSGEIRWIVWEGAIKVWQRYPWFGSGPETFAYSYYLDRPMAHNLTSEWDYLYNKAHNEFLNYLATSGIFGLISYVVMLGAMIIVGMKQISPENKNLGQNLAGGLIAGVMATMIVNFFGFSIVYSNFFLFFLATGIILGVKKNEDKIKKQYLTSIVINWKIIGEALGIIILGGILIIKVLTFWGADYLYTRGEKNVRQENMLLLTQGLKEIDLAIKLNPTESIFYARKADIYAQLAVSYYQTGKEELAVATISANTNEDVGEKNEKKNNEDSIKEVTEEVKMANYYLETAGFYQQIAELSLLQSLLLNPVALNNYQTAYRVYLNLAQIDTVYLEQAEYYLKQAIKLAPTEARLRYNLAVLHFSMGQEELGMSELWEVVNTFKSDYHEARIYLAQRLMEDKLWEEAQEQYEYILTFIDPDDERAKLGLEQIEIEMGKNQDSLSNLI